MDSNLNLEVEKFKIQKTQMYLQVASVIMSAVLLYVLISGNKKADKMDDDAFNNIGE
jgi:Na+-driven multidrug efflux pump